MIVTPDGAYYCECTRGATADCQSCVALYRVSGYLHTMVAGEKLEELHRYYLEAKAGDAEGYYDQDNPDLYDDFTDRRKPRTHSLGHIKEKLTLYLTCLRGGGRMK